MISTRFPTQRVVRGTAAVVLATFVDQDGEARTPGVVTVEVKRWDGTSVLPAGTPTTVVAVDGGPPYVKVSLTPAQTTQLDLLKCTWTEASGAVVSTLVDIAGGRYFSIFEARNIDTELRRVERFSDEDIKRTRDEVEDEVYRITGRSFVPRFGYDKSDLTGVRRGTTLTLAEVDVRSVRYVKVGGMNYAASYWELVGSRVSFGRGIELVPSQVANGPNNFYNLPLLSEIAYEYGWPVPPQDLKRAMLMRLRSRLLTGSTQIDPRATSVTVDGSTFSLSTPGQRGARTGIPEVDEVYDGYTRSDWKEDFIGSMRIV